MGLTDSYQNGVAECFQLGTIATNATSLTTVDTLSRGAFAIVDVVQNVPAATNTSAKWTSLVLSHGTTTDATNHTAITNMTGTTNTTATTAQFVLPTNNDTAVNQICRFYIDLRNKERFIGVTKQASANHQSTANTATLFRRPTSPVTDAERNVGISVVNIA